MTVDIMNSVTNIEQKSNRYTWVPIPAGTSPKIVKLPAAG